VWLSGGAYHPGGSEVNWGVGGVYLQLSLGKTALKDRRRGSSRQLSLTPCHQGGDVGGMVTDLDCIRSAGRPEKGWVKFITVATLPMPHMETKGSGRGEKGSVS